MGGLSGSSTSSEKAEIRRHCHIFLLSNPKTHKNFVRLIEEDRDWVLNYLSTGKEVILYQMITDFASLNISPKENFFVEYLFYSTLKDSQISTEDYENVKKIYTLMKLQTLGELN